DHRPRSQHQAIAEPAHDAEGEHHVHPQRDAAGIAAADRLGRLRNERQRGERGGDVAQPFQVHSAPGPWCTRPSFITKSTAMTALMSATGSPGMAMMSARLPASITPWSSTPSTCAACSVADCSAYAAGIPASTM